MTAAHCGEPVGEDPDLGLLNQLRNELAVRGIVMGDPADGVPVPFRDTPGAWCEIGLLDGTLAWTHLPEGSKVSPNRAIRPALALLGAPALPGPQTAPAADPRLPPNDAVGRALATRGLAVHPAGFDFGDGELHAGIFVTSPARPVCLPGEKLGPTRRARTRPGFTITCSAARTISRPTGPWRREPWPAFRPGAPPPGRTGRSSAARSGT